MRNLFVATFGALLLLNATGGLHAAQEAVLAKLKKDFGPPVMFIPKPATAPTIDGKLTDEGWKAAQPLTLGFLMGRWEKPTQKTIARVLADEKAIYFGVECYEKDPEKMVSAGDKRDGPLWNGDTVELFIDPGHKVKRFHYYHIIVNPKGMVFDALDKKAKAWDGDIAAKTGKFDGGWTVEVAIPMKDLGVAGAIPKVWGLNINRQRPELGMVKPKGAKLIPGHWKLNEPAKYREGEDSAWAPTWSHSSHVVQRFGHALLEVGTKEVTPPEKLFETLLKIDFDDGKTGPFVDAVIADENFRGPGKSIAVAPGKPSVRLTQGLTDLDDVMLIMCLKMPKNGRFYYFGRAPDNEQCRADRHEIFMTKEEADARKFVELDIYHTHADNMAWKCDGRRRAAPGSWAMMTGHFAEPSIGSILSPGTDWIILRTPLGQFRRQMSQAMVPISQNYPKGLIFHARNPYYIDNFVVFRGADVQPPEQVKGVKVGKAGEDISVSWTRAKDNTLTAYYAVHADKELVVETHQLSVTVPAAKAAGKTITVVAYDLYGNGSKPSKAVKN